MTMTDQQKNDSRSGIAIIIVLGVLAVMIVLAVAFAVSMRTEKTAAGYYIKIAKTRQLVHTALARAMADLEQDLASGSTGGSYPANWSVQAMDSGMSNAVHLYTGQATELLPEGIYEAAAKLPSPGTISGGEDKNAFWSTNGLAGFGIEDIGGVSGTVVDNLPQSLNADIPVTGSYRIYDPAVPLWSHVQDSGGRIAYLIVNLSGLLDAHHAGGAARMLGTNVAEIALSNLPDIADEGIFISDRDSDYYETLFGLADRNNGLVSAGPSTLGVYSVGPSAAVRADDGSDIAPVPLAASGQPMEEALEAAMRAGASEAEAEGPWDLAAQQLALNKLDYEDTNSVPQALDGPYVEAVPMLNEVWVQDYLQSSNTLDGGKIEVWIECAYPFTEDSGLSFEVYAEVTLVDAGFTYTPAVGPAPPMPVSAQAMSPYPIVPLQFFDLSGTNSLDDLSYTVEITNIQVRVVGGATVDKIPDLELTVPDPIVVSAVPVVRTGRDVLDPVLNWHSLHWDLNSLSSVFSYTNTKNAANNCTMQFWDANSNACDIDPSSSPLPFLHIANAPMQTPGELGCLYSPGGWTGEGNNPGGFPVFFSLISPINAEGQWIGPRPWRTVWLYDHGVCAQPASYLPQWNRLLDYIAVDTNTLYRGRINPNTELVDVWAAALTDMPIGPLPGDMSTQLTYSAAMLVASNIVAQTAITPMASVSGLGSKDVADAVFLNLSAAFSDTSEIQKEVFYRNCPGLLHARQNLYLILLAAQTANDPTTFGPPFGVPRTDQRAMAVVWRDPVADANGNHRSFVRWFTWLKK